MKRRNVIRVAGVYVVTTWGLFQIAKTVMETLGLPKWTSTLTLLLLALGLPVVMILAWALERGPDGTIRMAGAPASDNPPASAGWIDGAVLLGVIAVLAFTGLQAGNVIGAAPLLGRGAPAAAERSVAVLPFANFSSLEGSEFFADGLTEEVINSLAQNPELKVAGRTSAFFYKGKNLDLREVGEKLGVAHVVEGSVRRDGDRLRVTAQLIKVSDGYHLWSKTYDRRMDDAFAIQSEIAEAVAGALRVQLASSQSERRGARDPEAYRMELTAQAYLRHWGLDELKTARETYARLMSLEPDNAEVRAGFALATIMLMQNYMAVDYDTGRRQAAAAIAEALRIDPASASAHIADGFLNYILLFRGEDQRHAREADAAFRRAIALDGRNPDALVLYGNFLAQQGRVAEAVPYMKRALDVDPLNRRAQLIYGVGLARSGRLDEAARQYREIVDLHPDFADAQVNLGELLYEQGKLAEAEPWLRAAATTGEDPTAILPLVFLYANLDMPEDTMRAADLLRATPLGTEVRDGLPLLLDGNFRGLLAYADVRIAKNDDPFWRNVAGTAAFLAGDAARARREFAYASPALFTPEPKVTPDRLDEALAAAWIARAQGDPAQERRLLNGVLKAAAPSPGLYDSTEARIARVKAYAQLGDRTRALAEFRAAIDAGYRTLWGSDDLVRIERYPSMASLRDDPEFKSLIRRVEADVARQRAQVLASRGEVSTVAANR